MRYKKKTADIHCHIMSALDMSLPTRFWASCYMFSASREHVQCTAVHSV